MVRRARTDEEDRVVSAKIKVKTSMQREEKLAFYIANGIITEEQIEELEAELFYGYGPRDNPDSPRYYITFQKEDGTKRQIKVTQFIIFEWNGCGLQLIGMATPELRQKLAEWSKDWPKKKDTTLDDLLENLVKTQK